MKTNKPKKRRIHVVLSENGPVRLRAKWALDNASILEYMSGPVSETVKDLVTAGNGELIAREA